MGEDGFPHAQVELVHDVGGKKLPVVDAMLGEALGECTLRIIVRCETDNGQSGLERTRIGSRESSCKRSSIFLPSVALPSSNINERADRMRRRYSLSSTRASLRRRAMSVLVPIFQNWSVSMRQSGQAHRPRNFMQASRHLRQVWISPVRRLSFKVLTSRDNRRHR